MDKSLLKKIENKILRLVDGSDNPKKYYKVLKLLYRFSKKNYLKFRTIPKTFNFKKPPVQNIYHAAVQKTGSQFIKAVFSDSRVQKHTKLNTYPQHEYEFGKFHSKFPKYTFVPGLYIPYELYEEIEKPKNYKSFYIIRDPRNIIVSWYYSMLETHRAVNKKVIKHRKKLNKMNFENGIKYCIKAYQLKFSFMRSWVYNSDDPNVIIVKFEDLIDSPVREFKKIFEHCKIDISYSLLKDVLNKYTKERMRQRSLARRKDNKSHYRRKSSNWKEVFTKEHERLFYEVTGNLVDILGY